MDVVLFSRRDSYLNGYYLMILIWYYYNLFFLLLRVLQFSPTIQTIPSPTSLPPSLSVWPSVYCKLSSQGLPPPPWPCPNTMHHPCTDAMHGPTCPSTKTQIRPQQANMEQDYMILLLYKIFYLSSTVNLVIRFLELIHKILNKVIILFSI